jgi:hypothetical protein
MYRVYVCTRKMSDCKTDTRPTGDAQGWRRWHSTNLPTTLPTMLLPAGAGAAATAAAGYSANSPTAGVCLSENTEVAEVEAAAHASRGTC